MNYELLTVMCSWRISSD